MFQKIEAAQQRGFTRSRRTNNDDDLALVDGQINTVENHALAEVFTERLEFDHRL